MTANTITKKIELHNGEVLQVERSFETVIVTWTHWQATKGGKPRTVTDEARALDLENALLAVMNLDYHNTKSRAALGYIRSTEWGAELP